MKKYEVSVSIALSNTIFYSNSHTESSFIIKPAYCHNNDLNLKLNSRPDTVNYSIFNKNLEVCQQQASVKKQLIKECVEEVMRKLEDKFDRWFIIYINKNQFENY